MDLAGLFKARQSSAPPRESLLMDGVRACGDYLASLQGAPDRRHTRLLTAIGALVVAHAAESDDSFDALLRAGDRALELKGEAESRLALSLADTAKAIRVRSKGAWRLRGLALEALGRDEEAIESYERHIELHNDQVSGDIALRLRTLRETRDCLAEAVGLLPAGSPLAEALGRPAAKVRAAFSAAVQERLGERGGTDPAVRRLVELYSAYRRTSLQGHMADPLLGGARPLGIGPLRNLIAGRTICVVIGAEGSTGDAHDADAQHADAHDLVVRLDNFRAGTGTRTDVHALTLRGDTPWEGPGWSQPVPTRLVFGDGIGPWRQAVRRRLVPGAQEHIGDPWLRRPVQDPALLGETGWSVPSTAFTVLRLLDFLDVSPRIDVVGLGLPGGLRPKEEEWVMAHARETDTSGTRAALR
jgi:hypothetical protein